MPEIESTANMVVKPKISSQYVHVASFVDHSRRPAARGTQKYAAASPQITKTAKTAEWAWPTL